MNYFFYKDVFEEVNDSMISSVEIPNRRTGDWSKEFDYFESRIWCFAFLVLCIKNSRYILNSFIVFQVLSLYL
jgi:hypothetical protein